MKRARQDDAGEAEPAGTGADVVSAYVEGVALGVREIPYLPKKPARFFCRNCSRDITLEARMRCAVCTPHFLLCLTCFSVGAELAPHKAHHDYYILRSTHFPLYEPAWGADEELLLLEGISLYGLGNWFEIGQHVRTRTSDECNRHFFAVYVDSPSYPDPIDPLPEETIAAALPMPIRPRVDEKKPNYKPGLSLPMKANLGSFMPLRGEFDTPYNEDAEDLPADIVFNEDDTDEERLVKVQALQAFTGMLHERRRKTEFLRSYDLLDWKSHQQFDRTLSKEDHQMLVLMRPFLQFLPKREWEKFVNGVLVEQHLRREILYHQSLRQSGVRNLADAASLSTSSSSSLKKRLKHSSSSGGLDGRHNLRSSGTLSKPPPAVSDALAPAEVEFCEAFALAPSSYVMIKEACIRESARAGMLSKKDARLIAGLPKFHMQQLYEFFLASGWIQERGVRLPDVAPLPPHNPELLRQYFAK